MPFSPLLTAQGLLSQGQWLDSVARHPISNENGMPVEFDIVILLIGPFRGDNKKKKKKKLELNVESVIIASLYIYIYILWKPCLFISLHCGERVTVFICTVRLNIGV